MVGRMLPSIRVARDEKLLETHLLTGQLVLPRLRLPVPKAVAARGGTALFGALAHSNIISEPQTTRLPRLVERPIAPVPATNTSRGKIELEGVARCRELVDYAARIAERALRVIEISQRRKQRRETAADLEKRFALKKAMWRERSLDRGVTSSHALFPLAASGEEEETDTRLSLKNLASKPMTLGPVPRSSFSESSSDLSSDEGAS